jgi:ElaB/YqjD/DUF883 family membrane-anchored ribosome-binding protein
LEKIMTDVREKVKSGIDTVADQAKSATDQAKSATDRGASVVGQVKHKAEEAVEAVGEYAHDAKDKVQHFAEEAYDTAGDKLGTLSKDVTELVKKYPIQALLIGFGAGMLMGRASRA